MYDKNAAIAVIGVAGFQLLQAWNTNAPSLAELRNHVPGDVSAKQKLIDADFMVGGLAIVLGISYAILTHDLTALLVMLAIFGSVAVWHHAVLAAENI